MADVIRLDGATLYTPDPVPNYQFLTNFQSLMTQLHTHVFYEFFYIIAGRVVHVVNDARQELAAGALVFVRPDDAHAYARLDDAECELVNVAFPREIVERLFAYLGSDFTPENLLRPALSPVTILAADARAHLLATLTGLAALPQRRVNVVLRGFLADVFTQYFATAPPDAPDQPAWFVALCQAMQQPDQFIAGYEALRARCNVSPEHLTRTFRQYLDLTPTDYINALRLDYAANLLIHTDRPVVDVAFDAGFGNLSHFYHLFKRRFELPPARYRRAHRHHAIP